MILTSKMLNEGNLEIEKMEAKFLLKKAKDLGYQEVDTMQESKTKNHKEVVQNSHIE